MPKENLLFQLDTKEFQYHKLNHSLRYFNPRFHTTKLIKNANRNSKNQIKNNKKLKNIDLDELYEEIVVLRKEILTKKLYRICLKFNTKLSNNSAYSDELKQTLRQLVLNRIVKSLKKKFKRYESEYRSDLSEMDENAVENPFKNWQDWVSETDIVANLEEHLAIKKLKDSADVGKETNKIISKLYQDKNLKLAMSEFEDGMDVFLNINRGSKKVERRSTEEQQIHGDTEYTDRYSDRYNNDMASDDDIDTGRYDNMIGHSSDDDNNDDADNNNYNDDDAHHNKSYSRNLPELEHGFIDNYNSDSEDERAMEKELKQEKPKKKNRRGQRERRLIWEKKYGKSANHIQKKITEETASKLERQQKYEERVVKRLEREQEYLDRLHARKQKEKEFLSKEFHPSWEAKKIQKEQLKKIKFAGKKVTFD